MRRGRLFRKLFLAFWLATVASFVTGSVYFTLSGGQERNEAYAAREAYRLLDLSAAILAGSGAGTLRSVLADWNGLSGGATLILAEGVDETYPPTHRRTVRLADGRLFTVSSDVLPIRDPKPPGMPIVPIIVGAVVSLVFSAVVAWYLLRPLFYLVRAFRAVSVGRFETRVAPSMGTRRDEIADLGRHFDGMASRLQTLVETRERLLHDLSHELRSPLARVQAAIGLSRQKPEKADMMLDRIDQETRRLDEMIGELLTLARLEERTGSDPVERVDLVELLGAIAEDAAFEARARAREVVFRSDGCFVAEVRAELLCRAFENVIRNAVRYTAEGTTVAVTAHVSDGGSMLEVLVADHGPGVPADMLDRIFEPFLRLDTESSGGFGLGLSIARRAVEVHGGRISAEPAPGGGLAMRITVPASGVPVVASYKVT